MHEKNAQEIFRLSTTCCIAGGGPAGMMLGYLLARAGIDVIVLEKHADFLRDFRGDTIHPSTLEVIKELGLLEAFLQQPHQKAYQLTGYIGDNEFILADFSRLPVQCKFIALMPQWDFLNFIAEQAKQYPAFRLIMQAQVTALIEEDGKIAGAHVTSAEGPLEIRAALTVGADGRHSTVREKAGLSAENIGAPIDVLWMRLTRLPTDPAQPMGRFDRGKLFVMIYRGDYWQCAYVIAKGGYDAIQQNGLESFRASIAEAAPFMRDRVQEISSWEQVKLLTVTVDYLHSWFRPALLCIGDAAHAMSPVGGVGINLAIQDAVAAANILIPPLRENRLTDEVLQQVQKRREFPTRMTQKLQVFVQNRILGRVIKGKGKLSPPWLMRLLLRWPMLRYIPARLIGLGFRPEHVKTENFH
jgi:2-polyprenyl-6-methoxyphenol hydroxylase-like FAD-dependent oxidoreductase